MLDPETLNYLKEGYLRGKFTPSLLKDVDRVYIIKKQLTKYKTKRTLNIRLLLNNIILLFNCFTPSAVKRLLYDMVLCDFDRSILKTCMIKINFMESDEWPDIDIHTDIDVLLRQTLSTH